jgi:hypothetical protein
MYRIMVFFLFCFFGHAAFAQWQVGLSGGVANYHGDLTDKVYLPALTKAMAGGHLGYELSQRVMLRGSLSLAKVAGHDRYSGKSSLRNRNLSFESKIYEASLVAEVHTFRMDDKRLSPYIFGGIALFHFNPYTFDTQNQVYYLQPLSTEGQGLPGYNKAPYALNQWAIPFGGGLRFNVTDKIILGGEIGMRKLFTDYLDDVSTEYAAAADLLQYRGPQAVSLAYRRDEVPVGNPAYPAKGTKRGGAKYKDYYYFTSLSLSFRLGNGRRFGSDSRKSGYGCPAVF